MKSSIANDHFFSFKINLSSPIWSKLVLIEVEDNHAHSNNHKKCVEAIAEKSIEINWIQPKITLVLAQNIIKKRGLSLIFAKRLKFKFSKFFFFANKIA
jgi:hypothetical protein